MLSATNFNFRQLYLTISLITMIWSCNSGDNISKVSEKYKVLNTLILSVSVVPPAPPPSSYSDQDISKYIDSISTNNNNPLKYGKIAIYPYFQKFESSVIMEEDYSQNYANLLLNIYKYRLEERIDKSLMQLEQLPKIVEINDIKILFDSKEWNKFDLFFSVTEISIDSNNTHAMAIVSTSYSRNNGSTYVVYLKNENSKWIIIHNQLLNIS